MSEPEGGEQHGEIVIIHRHGDHEDAHHGGAWKIAFADFMTAMMAFFLVMWLINSTDEQTLSQVATYFSPIKLTDRTVTTRGLYDAKSGGAGKETEENEQRKKEGKAFSEPKRELGEKHFPEEELFADPYDTLAKLAMQVTKVPPRPGGGLREEGHAGGEAFRDPFDPDFRSSTQDGPIEGADAKLKPGNAEEKSGKGPAAKNPEQEPTPQLNELPGPEMRVNPSKGGRNAEANGDALAESGGQPAQAGKKAEANAEAEAEAQAQAQAEKESQPAKEETEKKSHPETQENAQEKSQPAPETQPARRMAAITANARSIEKEFVRTVTEIGLVSTPAITVTGTPEGVLISLTDKMNFEMFAIASAEPRPEMVVVMEKLGKVLASQPGNIVIRGHTDSRPFRSKTYDNWRLSTARAHISYYMLVRAGVTKNRIERIEGYADRSPKNPQNPRAAENRRIEILLRPVKP